VLLAGGCATKPAAGPRSRPGVAIRTAIARNETLHPSETLAGIIAPLREVALSSSLPEPAIAVYVHEGMTVRKGQVLARLAIDDLQAKLAAAKQSLAVDRAKATQVVYQSRETLAHDSGAVLSARSEVAQDRITLQRDSVDLQRDEALATKGYLASQVLDQQQARVALDGQALRAARAQLSAATADINLNGNPGGAAAAGLLASNISEARAQARVALAQVQEIEREIARAVIVSPVNGIVINRNLNPGEYPSGRQIFTLQEISQVYAVLNASSRQVYRLRPGLAVKISRNDTSRSQSVRGAISAVLPQAQPGSTNFAIKADIANPTGAWLPGMPVVATIELPSRRGVTIPTGAFLNDRRDSVMIVRGDRLEEKHVREVVSDPGRSIVAGLAAGTRVVADGGLDLTVGTPVSVR
jgi:multidrug efflux pump subunit AcrA (membrane-fusion protein)